MRLSENPGGREDSGEERLIVEQHIEAMPEHQVLDAARVASRIAIVIAEQK